MKVKIKLPESLWEITLEQLQEYSQIEEPTAIDLVSVFLNIKREYVFDMPQKQLDDLAKHIQDILATQEKFKPNFKMNNIEFGFIPNFDKITAGENADCDRYIKDTKTLHLAMAVLWRPIKRKSGDKYELEKYKGTEGFGEAMKQMPLAVVDSSMLFFSTLQNDLVNSIRSSMSEAEHRAQLQQILEKNGVGMPTFTQLLAETFLILKKPLNQTYTRLTSSWRLNKTD